MRAGRFAMSGMSVSGKIMVQEAQAGGFEAHVYPSRIEAAFQLLRVEIRRSVYPERTIHDVETGLNSLIERERELLED